LAPICRSEYLKLPYSRRVYDWIIDYYSRYNEAPSRHIEELYELNKESLPQAEAELIALFLQGLSDEYDQQRNEKWGFDKAERYLRKRSLQLHREKEGELLDHDDIEGCEKEQAAYFCTLLRFP